jgi:hypothetical protein
MMMMMMMLPSPVPGTAEGRCSIAERTLKLWEEEMW